MNISHTLQQLYETSTARGKTGYSAPPEPDGKTQRWLGDTPVPVFSRPHRDMVWVLIVEKAFAKLVGGYFNLCGGHTFMAWLALTGCKELELREVY